MAYDNSQLAHIWAQQTKEIGKNGNGSFHFNGRSIYSYKTEIGRFIDNKVIYTSHTYTPTTSSKHQPNVRRAISHLETYSTSLRMKDIPDDWNAAAPILFKDFLADISDRIVKISKSRSYAEFLTAELCEFSQKTLKFYCNYIIDTIENPDSLFTDISQVDLNSLATNNATTGNELIQDVLKRHGIDLKEKLAQQKKIDAERQKQKQRDLSLAASEWRQHLNSRVFHGLPVMLRVSTSKDLIETSLGAKVSIDSAKLFYSMLKNHKDVAGFQIGEFTVSNADENYAVIGCHTIARTEILTIAEELGL